MLLETLISTPGTVLNLEQGAHFMFGSFPKTHLAAAAKGQRAEG